MKRRLRDVNMMWFIGAFVLLLSLLTAYRSYTVNARVAQISECQVKYMQSVNTALLARTDAADADRNNMFNLVLTISHAKTPTQSLAALHAYISAKEAADQNRATHPYPNVEILKECG